MPQANVNHLQSRYSVSRYFTPPRVEPLNLDLAKLEGGGSCPAQFYGQTHDGKEVYVRYRGGGLSVTVGDEPDIAKRHRILDATIGPPLHGDLSIGQLCHQFGITINGARPSLPTTPQEMYRERCKDLSGATTFYDVWLSSTFETQKGFLKAALSSLPHATLLQPILDQYVVKGYRACPAIEDLASDFSYLLAGKLFAWETIANIEEERLWVGELDGCVAIRITTCGFQYPIHKYGNDDAARVHRAIGKDISVAGQVDDCLYGTLSLHSQFRIGNSESRALLKKLDSVLDTFFPAHEISWFDLVTGEKETEDSYVMPLDPAVADWVNAAPDRWLHIQNKSDWQNPRLVGARPVRMV